MGEGQPAAAVVAYWLPIGAGGHVVRWNGLVYEGLVARLERREPADLYHAALQVELAGDRYVIEMASAWYRKTTDCGAVVNGPMGLRRLGRFRAFRYEIRRWRDGVIPDADEAVDSPVPIESDPERAGTLLDLVPRVPALTWGRDERRAGEMWNSNSVVAWLLARSGHDVAALRPPAGGRLPGWAAGLAVAGREPAGGPSVTTHRP